MIKQKLRSKKGETITEVLIAALVGCFGALLFATMSSASTKVIQRGMDALAEYTDVEQVMEVQSDELSTNNIRVTDSHGTAYKFTEDTSGGKVKVYGDEDKEIYAYSR